MTCPQLALANLGLQRAHQLVALWVAHFVGRFQHVVERLDFFAHEFIPSVEVPLELRFGFKIPTHDCSSIESGRPATWHSAARDASAAFNAPCDWSMRDCLRPPFFSRVHSPRRERQASTARNAMLHGEIREESPSASYFDLRLFRYQVSDRARRKEHAGRRNQRRDVRLAEGTAFLRAGALVLMVLLILAGVDLATALRAGFAGATAFAGVESKRIAV